MLKARSFCTFALAATLAFAPALPAWSAAPKLTDPLPVNPDLKRGKLPNGLTYYIEKNAKPANRVELRLVIKAGSVLEDDDQRGLAHFVEHMGFNGSRHFKKHELIAYLQSIGVRFGADLNASTSFDTTIYTLPVPTDKPGNLEQGFTVLEDWAHGMDLETQPIEDERNIILEEKRMRGGFPMRALEAQLPRLANGSRYQDRLPIGTEESIAHSKPEAVRRFYRDWYRPDLMAVVVVGDIDPAEAEGYIKRHFSSLKMPANPRPVPDFPLRPLTGQDAMVFVDKEAPASTIQLIYSTYRHPPVTTVGDFRRELVKRVFATLMSVRFNRLTQQEQPPFVFGASGESGLPFGFDQRAYVGLAMPGKGGVDVAIDALIQENQRARQFGFTEAELSEAKRNLVAGMEFAAKSRPTQESAAVLGAYVGNFLSGDGIPGIAKEVEYAHAFLPELTLDEVNAYARTVLPAAPPKLVIYTANSEKGQPVPSTQALLARVERAFKQEVAKREEKGLPSTVMTEKPVPGSIVEERQDAAVGLTYLTLSNGVKVVLKPADYNKDMVSMVGGRPGGAMLFPEADKNAMRWAAALAGAMGVSDFAPMDLKRILAGRTANAVATMTPYSDMLTGFSRTGDLETMLQLTYLTVTQPRRDPMLFRAFIANNSEAVRTSMASPDARFSDARLQTVFGGHPRITLQARPEDFEKLDLDHTMNLFESRMSSAKGMTFYLVGDFELAAIKPLLATYLGSLPVRDIPIEMRDPGIRQVPGVEQKSTLTLDFGGDMAYSRPENRAFRALVDVLNIRIVDELRERQKLIYAGNVAGGYELIPRAHYTLTFRLPTAPANVDKLRTALWAEIERLQVDGPSEDDLNKVKQAAVQQYRQASRQIFFWIGALYGAQLEGIEPAQILETEREINAVTAEQVRAAAKRFMNKQQYVEMVQKPET